MNSLLELNAYSATEIEVEDNRASDVIFDRRLPIEQIIDITSTTVTVSKAFNIVEIINYQVADVEIQVSIKSAITPNFYTNSSLSFGTLPAGVTQTVVNGVYTLTGINKSSTWTQLDDLVWTLPSDYQTFLNFYLEFKISWYSQAEGAIVFKQFDIYDPDYYFIAQLNSQSAMTSQVSPIRDFAADFLVTSSLITGDNFKSEFRLTCNARATLRPVSNLTTVSTLAVPVIDNFMTLSYQTITTNQQISFGLIDVINVKVYWGDGTSSIITTSGNVAKTYAAIGTYRVTIIGLYNGFDGLRNGALRRVLAFPTDGLQQLTGLGVSLLEIPTQLPPSVTSLYRCFYTTSSSNYFNLNISSWNTSNVTNMSEMFYGNKLFNININSWDVSNVTNMSGMFRNADAFNQSLNSWNVGNVTDMSQMFSENEIYNQSLSNWNVANVTNMSAMFRLNTAFNQDINNWNVSKVTNISQMFSDTTVFNSPLNNWNLSSVTVMNAIFLRTQAFNQPLSNWNVSKVTNMTSVFAEALVFNQNINNWDVSNVTTMQSMFSNTGAFNQSLSNWNVSKVTSMQSMFSTSQAFNQNISNWNVSSVTDMAFMFAFSKEFNQPIESWNVSNVTNMDSVFLGAAKFNQPLNNWNVGNATRMVNLFRDSIYNQPLNNWDVSKVTTMEGLFFGSEYNQPLLSWNTGSVTSMLRMFEESVFNQPIGTWNTGNVTNMNEMFQNNAVFDRNISTWCVSKIPVKPLLFDSGTSAGWTTAEKPIWGTCP
jgi:surface protein